jgi:hypothetical protein
MKLKKFFCQFPNPWALRVSGMGGSTSKCEKKSKSLHPNGQGRIKKKRWLNQNILPVSLQKLFYGQNLYGMERCKSPSVPVSFRAKTDPL